MSCPVCHGSGEVEVRVSPGDPDSLFYTTLCRACHVDGPAADELAAAVRGANRGRPNTCADPGDDMKYELKDGGAFCDAKVASKDASVINHGFLFVRLTPTSSRAAGVTLGEVLLRLRDAALTDPDLAARLREVVAALEVPDAR